MQRRLILFLRAPVMGRGKRRLARAIGDGAALGFERVMIARLLRRLGRDRRWRLRIAVTPDRACREMRRWARTAEIVPQHGGDLGMRMWRALAAAPSGPVVLIGSDDVVFGPAVDGGFWLVGARRRPRLAPLFQRVRWSSPNALADTLAGLPRGLAVGFVATLEDVDTAAGYRRLKPQRGF
jgi:glycosyltransferase A (GT-A) superfamily protein (DUF2064 family)